MFCFEQSVSQSLKEEERGSYHVAETTTPLPTSCDLIACHWKPTQEAMIFEIGTRQPSPGMAIKAPESRLKNMTLALDTLSMAFIASWGI